MSAAAAGHATTAQLASRAAPSSWASAPQYASSDVSSAHHPPQSSVQLKGTVDMPSALALATRELAAARVLIAKDTLTLASRPSSAVVAVAARPAVGGRQGVGAHRDPVSEGGRSLVGEHRSSVLRAKHAGMSLVHGAHRRMSRGAHVGMSQGETRGDAAHVEARETGGVPLAKSMLSWNGKGIPRF